MEMNTSKQIKWISLIKFIGYSLLGVIIFFVNIPIGGQSKVPLVHLMDNFKALLGPRNMQFIVLFACFFIFLTSIWAKFGKNVPKFLKDLHERNNAFSYFLYSSASIFTFMIVFNIGPEMIIAPNIGGSSVSVTTSVITAITIAGALVAFLTEFGFLEFLGKLIEPIMRAVYKLPGKAALDALASFVVSAAVGVMITNDLYKGKVYTEKEACSITTNFSVCSIAAFAFLSSIAGVGVYFSQIVLTSFIITFVVAAIMIRIPPLSKRPNTYYDGTVQPKEERISRKYSIDIFKEAIEEATNKAESSKISTVITHFKSSVLYAMKVSTYVVSLAVICLFIANYTPIAKWLGAPMVPILNLLQIPDALTIAPSTLIGFLGLAIPSTLLKGTGVSAMAAFFIVVLSTSQIIFFTESANAMLDSEIPLNFLDLLIIFLLRTVILLPFVAIATHIIF